MAKIWSNLSSIAHIKMNAIKLLLTPQNASTKFGLKAMEDEISSTLTIEDIDFTLDSVRQILKGFAPKDDSENRIFGLKNGLEYVSDIDNKITEQNIHALYQLAIGNYLAKEEDKLLPGNNYRHDTVFVVGLEIEHTGLPFEKLPTYIAKLVDFVNAESQLNTLLKAAVIHFYIAYLHPYFDGNGRMARLLHLWYLVQQGFPSALFIPLSSYIEKSRRQYYNAYTLAEQNSKISSVMDVTPFLNYFAEHVYNKLQSALPPAKTMADVQNTLASGTVTVKENELWNFVLSAYSRDEFTTKQLERDFGNAAYATIRSFVLKFEKMGLLVGQRYSNKVKYRISL